MKNFFTITETAFAAMLLASAVAVHAADEATERRLGIRAVANGDYSNAVNFFKSALALSGEDQEKWAANAVDLAAAKLRTGDLAGARELLAEFRSRFPARSAGLLPGEIMISERKYDDAEKFFQSLAASAADPELSCQARYALALSRLHQNKFPAALADLEQLERENADLPSWAARAHLTRIYTLLASGDLKTAEELLKQDKYRKELPDRYRRLELALMLKRRQFDSFYRLWPEIAAEAGDRQDKLLYDLAVSGALQAAAAKQYDAAVRLLNDGFRFAGNDLERRNALRELINVDAMVDPERAADAIKRYLEFFPEANDRTELLLRGARLLASVKSYDRAIALFTQVTGDNRIPTEQRLGAAREAAVTAQAAGRPEVARRMYRYLIEQAETPDQRLEGNYLFGEYSFREKNFRQAANLLKTVADSGSNRADAARYRLLQSLVELKRYKEAEPVAEALRRSPVQTHATSADFYRALLLEKAGHSAEARSEYLKFLVAHPDSEYSPRALFSAAELAMELREYPAAVREFFEFAEKNPKSDSAPAALYQAMQSGYFARNAAETRRAIELLEKKYGPEGAAKRIYATTDRHKGALKALAVQAGYESFVVPDDIGGRYSVLTAVGLLPIAVAGVDIQALMQGAARMHEACTAGDMEQNPAWQYAGARYQLYRAGKKIEVLAAYEPAFRFMSEWWKQLYGESEGKESKGLFPASVEFTADLHSMGQYIQQGERHLFETVVRFDPEAGESAVPFDAADGDGLNFLAGKTMDFIRTQAMDGTLLAHEEGGVPNIILRCGALDADALGQLIYFFEYACGLSGYLLDVNPFDQPGVEAYKKNMFALLGKPGYEDMGKALREKLGR